MILCKLQKSRDKIKDNDATHVLQSKLEDIFDKICFDTRFLLCLPLPSVGFIFIKINATFLLIYVLLSVALGVSNILRPGRTYHYHTDQSITMPTLTRPGRVLTLLDRA